MINQPHYDKLLSSYVNQIDALFDMLEGEESISNERLASASATSVTTYDEESGVQRARAPLKTKCGWKRHGGCGGGGGGQGGKVTVDILNSVGSMTANIINSVAGAAAVILPPIANTVGDIVINWMDPKGDKNRPPPPPPPDSRRDWPPPPPPPDSRRDKPPPPPPPAGQYFWSNGQWVWVPAGRKPPPDSFPAGSSGGSANATANAYGGNASANATARGGNASATANSYPSASPQPTRSQMPQNINRQVSPAPTRTTPTSTKSQNPQAIQMAYKDIHNTLTEMDELIHNLFCKYKNRSIV